MLLVVNMLMSDLLNHSYVGLTIYLFNQLQYFNLNYFYNHIKFNFRIFYRIELQIKKM